MGDKQKARVFFKSLGTSERWDLGDQLVWGSFDWNYWLEEKPSKEFIKELCKLSDCWEQNRF